MCRYFTLTVANHMYDDDDDYDDGRCQWDREADF